MGNSADNKRIAKNTVLLYFRMFFTMGVTIYTSRVVLNTLGIEDYGIQNVAGGLISMFTFVNSSMNSTTQRYLNFAIGKGDLNYVRKIFSTAIQLQIVLSLFIVLLAETIGLWFLNEKLVIPTGRRDAAMWVYQFSIATALADFIFVPYTSIIVAREKMSVFAYMSILSVTLKLAIVYLLLIFPFDKLKLYAVLLFLLEILIKIAYRWYCIKHYKEASYLKGIDRKLFRDMMAFAGWNFFGLFSGVLCSQGVNIVLNMFFGPVVNAARGVANQVQLAVKQFVGNFQTAINPQITKSYAGNDLERMYGLFFRSAKFSFFLLWTMVLPIFLETDYLLVIWLKNVPDNAPIFTQIMLAISLIYTISNPCLIASQASGNIKKFQIYTSCILLFVLPVSYCLLKYSLPAYIVFVIQFLFELLSVLCQIFLLRFLIHLPLYDFIRKVVVPIGLVAVVSFLPPFLVKQIMVSDSFRFVIVSLVSFVSVFVGVYGVGLSSIEKSFFSGVLKGYVVNRYKMNKYDTHN